MTSYTLTKLGILIVSFILATISTIVHNLLLRSTMVSIIYGNVNGYNALGNLSNKL